MIIVATIDSNEEPEAAVPTHLRSSQWDQNGALCKAQSVGQPYKNKSTGHLKLSW